MRGSQLLGPDVLKALESDPSALDPEVLEELHAEDLAEFVAELPEAEEGRVLDALPLELAADVVARLPLERAVELVERRGHERTAPLLLEMAADDRADLIGELPEPLREQVLSAIEAHEPEVAEDVRALAAYEDDSAGGLMTTEFLQIGPELTAAEAIDAVRRLAREQDIESIYQIYVVAYERLVGVVSLRDLILGAPAQRVSELMSENVARVAPEDDQELVAQTMARYDLSVIPVADAQGRLLGIVTIDDVVDVLEEEATEDVQKMAAMVPIEESYFQTGFLQFMRSRLTWLVVLFVGELLTASVMHRYEADVAAVMDLVIFVPLIISSGGNSGSQSSSLIIRALALGEMAPRDWPRVLYRELGMGLALGSMLALVGFARAFMGVAGADPLAMGLTVACSVVAVVTLGTLVGSLMPLMIQRLGLDPAVSSTPFVASLVDVLGLFVYFTVARFIFALAL
ncbi:MAG: magnesium transporter [Myxococcales bacterium]|nr:magnesium transporter [Myxococcales bacterium]